MAAVKENLIAAKEVYLANRWSMHQAVDYSVDDDGEYGLVMDALKAAMPVIPPPGANLVRWSNKVGRPEIEALFDRAIAAQETPHDR